MLAAIGRVAGESAELEDQLRELLCYLIDSPYGRIIASGEPISRITNMCLTVAQYNRILTDDQITKLVAIANIVDTLSPMRNFLIHAQWEKGEVSGEHLGKRSSRTSPKKDGLGTYQYDTWNVADVLQLADSYATVGDAIESFIRSTFAPKHFKLFRRGHLEKLQSAMTDLFDRHGIDWRNVGSRINP